MRAIIIFYLFLIILCLILCSCRSKHKYLGQWIEKEEGTTTGHFRHNGILTDSGYLFFDTVWSNTAHCLVPQTTLITIYEIHNDSTYTIAK